MPIVSENEIVVAKLVLDAGRTSRRKKLDGSSGWFAAAPSIEASRDPFARLVYESFDIVFTRFSKFFEAGDARVVVSDFIKLGFVGYLRGDRILSAHAHSGMRNEAKIASA
jgi:hypothetical protein